MGAYSLVVGRVGIEPTTLELEVVETQVLGPEKWGSLSRMSCVCFAVNHYDSQALRRHDL